MFGHILILKYSQYPPAAQQKDLLGSDLEDRPIKGANELNDFVDPLHCNSANFWHLRFGHVRQGYKSTNVSSLITIRPPILSVFALNRPEGRQRPKLRNFLNGYILISVVHSQNQLATPSAICYSLTALRTISGQYLSQTILPKQQIIARYSRNVVCFNHFIIWIYSGFLYNDSICFLVCEKFAHK
jgi:hypothetical protein